MSHLKTFLVRVSQFFTDPGHVLFLPSNQQCQSTECTEYDSKLENLAVYCRASEGRG